MHLVLIIAAGVFVGGLALYLWPYVLAGLAILATGAATLAVVAVAAVLIDGAIHPATPEDLPIGGNSYLHRNAAGKDVIVQRAAEPTSVKAEDPLAAMLDAAPVQPAPTKAAARFTASAG